MSVFPSRFLKGSVITAGAAVLVGIFGYLTRRLLANNLEEADYAFFYSAFALINLAVILNQVGTSNVILFELPGVLLKNKKRYSAAVYHFIKGFQSFNSCFCTLIFLVVYPFLKKYYFNYPIHFYNFLLFALMIWGMVLESTTLFALNAFHRFGTMGCLRILKNMLFFLCGWIFVSLDCFSGIIASCVIATTACTIYGNWTVEKLLYPFKGKLHSNQKYKIVKDGIIFMILASGTIVLQDFGTCTLSLFSNSREVVLFNIALPLSMIVQSMLIVLDVFTPMLSNYYINKEINNLRKFFQLIFLFTAVSMLCAFPVFYYCGDFIITLMFSQKFIAAKWSAFFLIEAALLVVPVRALMGLFNVAGKKRMALIGIIPMSVATVILFPLLSYMYGATGASVAALLSIGVWLCSYLFFYTRFVKQELSS